MEALNLREEEHGTKEKKENEMKHSNIICLRLSDIELELVNHARFSGEIIPF